MKDEFEYHITFPNADINCGFDIEPVVILFGWAGCSDRHLAKYSQVYEKQGYITMRLVTSKSVMTPRSINEKKIYDVAEKVVALMGDMVFTDHPIFFHCFSNGGCIVYRYVSEIIRQKFKEEFQIKGCIFDSAPAKVDGIGLMKAAIAVTEGSIIWKYIVALYVLVHAIFLQLGNFFKGMLSISEPPKRVYEALLDEPNICPQLFLFSKSDEICHWKSIQSFADRRQEKGVKVNAILFDDSSHVQHLIMHKDAYSCIVISFIAENMESEMKDVPT